MAQLLMEAGGNFAHFDNALRRPTQRLTFAPSAEIRLPAAPESQHRELQRPKGPLLVALPTVAAFASVARLRARKGGMLRHTRRHRSTRKAGLMLFPGAELAVCAVIAPSGPAMDLLHARRGPTEAAFLAWRYFSAILLGWLVNALLPGFLSKALLRGAAFAASVVHLRDDLAGGDWTVCAFAHLMLLCWALLIGPSQPYNLGVLWLSMWRVPRAMLRHAFSSGRFDRSAVRNSLVGVAVGLAVYATNLYRQVPEWLLISFWLAHFMEDASAPPKDEEFSDDESMHHTLRSATRYRWQ
mmetsp:Transcript_46419/g.84996  ORF Transcript_46419/g.84996 Transcript_46419/m.84996 type:complete len:298 (+) Transcript_46419:90-983(+)